MNSYFTYNGWNAAYFYSTSIHLGFLVLLTEVVRQVLQQSKPDHFESVVLTFKRVHDVGQVFIVEPQRLQAHFPNIQFKNLTILPDLEWFDPASLGDNWRARQNRQVVWCEFTICAAIAARKAGDLAVLTW